MRIFIRILRNQFFLNNETSPPKASSLQSSIRLVSLRTSRNALIFSPFNRVECPLRNGDFNFDDIVMQNTKAESVQWVAGAIFLLSAAAYIAGPWVSLSWLQYFKIVPLIVVLFLILRGPRGNHTGIVAVGLVFGMLGDLVLEHGGDDLFALGAGLFLVNHILYNLYFLSLWRNRNGEKLFQRRIAALLACIVFISVSTINLVVSLSDQTKKDSGILVYLLPVYTTVLDLTTLNPLFLSLSEKTIQPAAIYMLVGGISYFISDNVLGMTRFGGFLLLGDRNINSLVIMTTYYIAQYFIPLSLKQRSKWAQEDELKGSMLSQQQQE